MNKLNIYKAKSLFRKLHFPAYLKGILNTRIMQLEKLVRYHFDEPILHYEILRYYPIAVICLYEYYFSLLSYVMLENLPHFSIDSLIQYKAKSTDAQELKKSKVSLNEYKVCCINFSNREMIIKFLSLLAKLVDGNSNTILVNIINNLGRPEIKTRFKSFKSLRNTFAHESIEMNPSFIQFLKTETDAMLSLLNEINSKIDDAFNDIIRKPIPIRWHQ